MRSYRPKFIRLSGSTPVSQCLCDYCENCELLSKALIAAGIKGIPSSKYAAIELTLCDFTSGQFGTMYKFRRHSCINRLCDKCGKGKLKIILDEANIDLLCLNKTVSWHKWQKAEGDTAPQKYVHKKPLKTAVNEYLSIVEELAPHCFRSTWNRGIFEYIKKNLVPGYVLQVMDFAMTLITGTKMRCKWHIGVALKLLYMPLLTFSNVDAVGAMRLLH